MITVANLTKTYAGVTAVNDISFEVAKNEILGFLGPNGAGKTTTLRILTGYLAATSGQVAVDGHDVFEKPDAVKRIIGYLPENVPLYPEMRVEEYLFYRAALKRVPRKTRRKSVDSAVERCRVGDVRQRIIGQLSKGYRQRVGLADALVGDPKILILDEPTIGLDPNQIRQVRDLIRDLGRERTVILSSHILPEVEAVCSRIQIIHRGRLAGQGKPEELRASLTGGHTTIALEVRDPENAAEAALNQVVGIRSIASQTQGSDGLVTYRLEADADQEVRERIFDAAVQTGFKITGLSAASLSLEDIFVEIITREETGDPEPSENSSKGGGA
ncbi:MAG: ATP-binding cassette domain-containing protein [Myxococcota bacterium]|nr:ATP-binding cassette domain-containing protein [Myxococcota bacterium]